MAFVSAFDADADVGVVDVHIVATAALFVVNSGFVVFFAIAAVPVVAILVVTVEWRKGEGEGLCFL